MKILHTVQSYYPSQGGMQEVVQRLSELMVKKGHDVTVATSKMADRKENVINGVKVVDFDVSGNSTLGLNGDIKSYEDFLLQNSFDIVTNFAAQQWATDVMLPILTKIDAKKVFVPTGFSGFFADVYKEYFENMKTYLKQYDLNIFLSYNYRDIKFAKENGVENAVVVPNGASYDEFVNTPVIDIREKLGLKKESFLILHVGSHTNHKGHREMFEIFNKIAVNGATLIINGNTFDWGESCATFCKRAAVKFNLSPARLFDKKKILLTNLPRNELISAYKQSDLFLFPSNIENSPIVLFEAMASKLPFVTSEAGNAREIVEWSNGGVIVPTGKYFLNGNVQVKIDEAATIITDLANNPEKRKSLGELGHTAWEKNFTWEKIADDYESLYKKLLAGEKIDFIKVHPAPSIDIDVVIPTYQHADFLMRAIDSVENQTYKPKNIIVVDDCSTDNTSEIIKQYKGDIPLQYIRKEKNEGPSASRNSGIKAAKSDYVALLDADDEWYPSKLEKQALVFENTTFKNLALVYSKFVIIDEKGAVDPNGYIPQFHPQARGQIFELLLETNPILGSDSGVLIKKEAFEKTGFFDETLGAAEDWDMWIRIARDFEVDYVSETLVKIRRHGTNMQKNKARMLSNELKFLNKWAPQVDIKTIPDSWEFSVANQIINALPDATFLNMTRSELSPVAKKKIFKGALGQVKLYVLKRLLVIIKNELIYYVKQNLIHVKNIFLIILK